MLSVCFVADTAFWQIWTAIFADFAQIKIRKEAYTFSNRWSCKFYIYKRCIFQYRQVITTLKKRLENVAGRLCEVLIPIKHEYYIGEGKL